MSVIATQVVRLGGAAGTAGVGAGIVPIVLPPGTSGIGGFCQWLALDQRFGLDAVSDAPHFVVQ